MVKQHETRLKTDKKHARDLQQAQAVTDEVQALLDETRQAFQESLAKTHEAKLEMQKEHAAQLNALQSELRETQKAFGEQLVKSHEQKINLINQHSVELRQADARTEAVREEMQEVQAAFSDHMARKQNELMERTTSLQKDVDSARSEAEAKQGELDQIQEAFNEHTQQTDDLIEAQGDGTAESAGSTPAAVGASAIAVKGEPWVCCVDGVSAAIRANRCSHDDGVPARAAPIGSGRHRRDERQKTRWAFSGVVTGFVDRRGFGFQYERTSTNGVTKTRTRRRAAIGAAAGRRLGRPGGGPYTTARRVFQTR